MVAVGGMVFCDTPFGGFLHTTGRAGGCGWGKMRFFVLSWYNGRCLISQMVIFGF